MKKFCSLILLISIMMLSVPTYAEEKNEIKYYDNVTETDEGFLFEKTEIVRGNKGENGRRVEKREYVLVVPTSEEYRSELRKEITQIKNRSVSGEGFIYEDSKWDSSVSFNIYFEIEVDIITVDYIEYGKITHSSGGFSGGSGTGSAIGNGVYISGQKFEIIVQGTGTDGFQEIFNDTKNISPSSRSWNYTTPSSCGYIGMETSYLYLVARYTVTARRTANQTTWDTVLSQNFLGY